MGINVALSRRVNPSGGLLHNVANDTYTNPSSLDERDDGLQGLQTLRESADLPRHDDLEWPGALYQSYQFRVVANGFGILTADLQLFTSFSNLPKEASFRVHCQLCCPTASAVTKELVIVGSVSRLFLARETHQIVMI